jgi:threonine 3-dehydrogenase
MGATRAVNVKQILCRRAEAARHEGRLRRGPGDERQPAAFRDMIDNMCHGGKIAMLGIPSEPIAIDWNKVIFNMLTIKGIYGREMYETWYKMSVMLESGLNIKPVITHRFHFTEFEEGFEAMQSGNCGKVVLDWTVKIMNPMRFPIPSQLSSPPSAPRAPTSASA